MSTSFWIRPNGIGGYEFSSPRDRTADEYVPARERDALAAHVERWKQWLGQDVEDDAGDWMDEGWSIANEAPATSLARLKARWQAEALGNVLAEVLTAVEADTVRAHLRNAMRKLRRQAEGENDA